MAIKLEMPRLSESISEGVILRWARKAGDRVTMGDCLADVETSNGKLELLAAKSGEITEILVKEGDKVQAGQDIAMLEPELSRFYSSTAAVVAVDQEGGDRKASPLARKIAESKGIDMAKVAGTGPRGKVMAGDLASARQASSPKKEARNADLPIAKKASQEHRIIAPVTKIDGYYVYSFEANMSQLAEISTPIAVQCEKFLGGRYCLFDYVARAAVKAFASKSESLNADKNLDLLMVVNRGEQEIALPESVKKTIHDIALSRNIGNPQGVVPEVPADYAPDLLVCDAGAQAGNLAKRAKRPVGLVFLGGTSPKTAIEAGRPIQKKLMLPLTVYIDADLQGEKLTSRIAAEFKSLMENPVLLLF